MGPWKKGDVAWIKGDGMDTLAIRTATNQWVWVDKHGSNPVYGGVCLSASDTDGRARPVVVIDPEDREAVERLVQAYYDARGHGPYSSYRINSDEFMQAALREFANPKPPRPEEPTGLGAVVEDEHGEQFVRVTRANMTYPGEVWEPTYGTSDRWWTWDQVNAVEVKSQGWSE